MSHLYDWKGYLVKRNIKVGKLAHGGWEGELHLDRFSKLFGHLSKACIQRVCDGMVDFISYFRGPS